MPYLPKQMESYLEQFEASLHAKHKEPSTVKIYMAEVRHFLEWVHFRQIDLWSVGPDDLIVERNLMTEKGMKSSTVNKSISALSTFFNWARTQGYLQQNPAGHLRLRETNKSVPRWLSHDEENCLLRCAAEETSPFKKARNEALIFVMLYAGLRLEEVSELRIDSFQSDFLVVCDNGSESRRVPIDRQTSDKLTEWLKHRQEAGKPVYQSSPYLFVTERSGRMQPRAVQFVIEGYSEKLGLLVLCQHLRHTYCRRLAVQGMPIDLLRIRAGHKSLLSTQRYYVDIRNNSE